MKQTSLCNDQVVLDCLEDGAGTCRNADYIEELLARIKELKTENRILSNAILASGSDHTHCCRKCGLLYTPRKGESEDCPLCDLGE